MPSLLKDWGVAASDEAAGMLSALGPNPDAPAIQRARKTFEPGEVNCAIELSRARAKAASKWPEEIASRIVSDREGLEMASGWHAARHKADRFAKAGLEEVHDLCCGIGGDSMGLASRGLRVLSVDRDQTRVWMCGRNVSLVAQSEPPRCTDVLDESLSTAAPFHLDPARRSGGNRVTRFEDLEPGPEVINRIVDERPCGAVKLNPGIDAYELPHGELEIISERGRLTQAVLWTGELAEVTRRATVLSADGTAVSISGEPDRSDECHPVEQYLFSMNPVIERADLVPVAIDLSGLHQVHPGLGLLTASSIPQASADLGELLTRFELIEEMAWNQKRVKARLGELDAGVVEVKTRDKVVNPDVEQRRIRGTGSRLLTVFVYRFNDKVRALITQRCSGDGSV